MGYSLNHLVIMVTNNKTNLSHSVYQNYHRNMECDTDESHFLNLESEDLDRLESLADSYLSTRTVQILLRLHRQFQPGRKTLISVRKFTEVRKHNRYACSCSFFSPG